MVVHAPFRFAPIHRWVYFPDWADLVTHDVPFVDGISGEIEIEIEARTPLLVGGPRRKPGTQPGSLWPFVTKGDSEHYAIPSSSLQGMARSILEIAACGRLAPFVHDRRFGFRDIGNTQTAIEYYRKRLVGHSRPGWLIKRDGKPAIVPCQMARIEFSQINTLKGLAANINSPLHAANPADVRYRWFIGAHGLNALNQMIRITPAAPHDRAVAPTPAVPGTTAGTLVLTGKTTAGTEPGKKKREFIFHTPDRRSAMAHLPNSTLTIDNDVWRDFELIHDAQPGRPANPNWLFWKPEYDAGNPVPVFFLLEHGRVATLGTAFMFKAALPLSTHEMLRNSHPEHVRNEVPGREPDDRLDFPSLVLGEPAVDQGRRGLKRRVSFDAAVVIHQPNALLSLDRAILLEPKPAYYPAYVRQPGDRTTGVLDQDDRPYALYHPSDRSYSQPERREPQIAGVKVWPARDRIKNDGPPSHLAENTDIQMNLHALPIGTRARSRLRFHNLRPVELGGILWALTFGQAAAFGNDEISLRHRLGNGKPYGLGEITIRVVTSESKIIDMCGSPVECAWHQFVAKFVAMMEERSAAARYSWQGSEAIRTLLAAADPEFGKVSDVWLSHSPHDRRARALDYMELKLGGEPAWNEFALAKQRGRFLPGYMKAAVLEVGASVEVRGRGSGVAIKAPNDPRSDRWLIRFTDGKEVWFSRSLITVIG